MFYPSKNAIQLIKKWEGCFLEAYTCPANVPTIGYGTTQYPSEIKVNIGDKISGDQAELYLIYNLFEIAFKLNTLIKNININQNQFDALLSFIYNVGITAFTNSTLYKKLLANDFDAVPKQLIRWNKVTIQGQKVELDGLTNRRKEEINLFIKQI